MQFETLVQANYVALMLSKGFAPCLPKWPISKIKLQGKHEGFSTDDCIIYVKNPESGEERKLLGQIKHVISITENTKFKEVIQAAWDDYNTPEIFKKNVDVIALITGPLSATDTQNVHTLLEWARWSENATDFFTRVDESNFSSDQKRKKLNILRSCLREANGGSELSNQVLFDFLRHFHLLGYDLDQQSGACSSLIQSVLKSSSGGDIPGIWTQICSEVQHANKNAGVIIQGNLSDDLLSLFKEKGLAKVPEELSQISDGSSEGWENHECSSELAVALLIGGWDENNVRDVELIEGLVGQKYSDWIKCIRKILLAPNSPIEMSDSRWKIRRATQIWPALGKLIFDAHLDSLKTSALIVLAERDPKFELPQDKRFAASIHGKVLEYSPQIRKGLTEGLALIGCFPEALTNCSNGKASGVAALSIRELLSSDDWILWGSLNSLLPILCEADPEEFLKAIEAILNKTPCPFDELFSQEGSGLDGGNYLTGLLWSLESLAWDPEYIVRSTALLGALAERDPGGNWANRPANSLTTIFLPWLPQTIADEKKREVALNTIILETPEAAWNLLLSLLPNQHSSSSGTSRPKIRSVIPEDWKKGVTRNEYRKQSEAYTDMAINLAGNSIDRLEVLAEQMDRLSKPAFNRLLTKLEETFTEAPTDSRTQLWEKLNRFTTRHRRHANTDWALDEETLLLVDKVTHNLKPSSPLYWHRRLFSDRDFDLYEQSGDWKNEEKKLEAQRENAISEIFNDGGIDNVLEFSERVERPESVGNFLAHLGDESVDQSILPMLLCTENRKRRQLVGGYIWTKRYLSGWEWAASALKDEWNDMERAEFLKSLPFSSETWQLADDKLGSKKSLYWSTATVNPYATEADTKKAIQELLNVDRPHAAIDCFARDLHAKKGLVDRELAVTALLSAVNSNETNAMDTYNIEKIIEALQADPNVDPELLFRVEWAYLPLLDSYNAGSPKLLEGRLASDPEFFCELIQLVFRSKNDDKKDTKDPTEQEQTIAENAWRLLHQWKTPPGSSEDKSIKPSQLQKWMSTVTKNCKKSGHIVVAQLQIGEVLFHSGADKNGLWIDENVASILNKIDSEDIRRGFSIEARNSRGAHWVDPSAKPEKKLAEEYREKAESVENSGYHRFAVTLRELADDYDRDAERILSRKGDDD